MTIAIENGKRNKQHLRRNPADWFGLAASPVFAAMALLAVQADAADPICSAMTGPLPLDGMAFMYLLMCLFHMPPWMKLRSAPQPLSKETDR